VHSRRHACRSRRPGCGLNEDYEPRIEDLYAIPAALGLPPLAVHSERGRVARLGDMQRCLLAVGEIFTPALFFLGPIAGGAVSYARLRSRARSACVAAAPRLIGRRRYVDPLSATIAARAFELPPALRKGTAALTGAHAVVLQRVDQHGGRVKIGGRSGRRRAIPARPGARAGTQSR